MTKKEIWKNIPNYKGYRVSNLGRVKSLDRTINQRGWKNKNTLYKKDIKGRMLRPGRNTKHGHVTVALGRGNSISVHVLVMRAFKGPCPKGKEVLHGNGIANDNRLCNLRYGTRSENNIDSLKHGTRTYKLNKKYVKEIKILLKQKIPVHIISELYEVCHNAIYNISTNKSWGWL